MAHHPLVTHPRTADPLAPPSPTAARGSASPTENHVNTVIAILGATAGITGITLAAWHGWKARRR